MIASREAPLFRPIAKAAALEATMMTILQRYTMSEVTHN